MRFGIDAVTEEKAIRKFNKKYPGMIIDKIRSYELGRVLKRHWIECHFER